ncbi:MAG TPA: hypothetical protein VJM12_05065 [Pyrinomonadaceae bacterium]|nr:hypothetical protein [Pyrinomonadaceae bacterium]
MTRTIFAVPILALTFLGILANNLVAQRRPASRQPAPQNILFDFRNERTTAPPQIPLTTQKYVLSKVFRKYLTDENKCNPDFVGSGSDNPLAAARRAGQIVPSILHMATGSFTGPLKQETLYLISVSECNASHADNFGTKRVAIFSGQQLVADMDADFKSGIVKKTDLNGDGIDELLMTTGDMNQGVLIQLAALISFQNGRFRAVEDFGTVMEDSCASGFPGSSAKASVVSISEAAPGAMPRLRIDNYEAGCRRTRRWRHISTGKMQ